MSDLNFIMNAIVQNRDLHGRWLNTFSYLEYIGFRKIVKSQHALAMNFETLGHAVEEGRHALLLKKLAIKMGGHGLDSYAPQALLCGSEAESYFQSLDHFCESRLSEMPPAEQCRLTYLYVTWLIEVRAIAVYQNYRSALESIQEAFPLNGLLAEEDRHLETVENELRNSDPLFASRVVELKEYEETLYQTFLAALNRELSSRSNHAEL